MNNPLRILQTLDRHLTRPAEITLFGRAALALGYGDSPPEFAGSHNVDAILPLPWLAAEDENMDFWRAQVKTNAELQQEEYLSCAVNQNGPLGRRRSRLKAGFSFGGSGVFGHSFACLARSSSLA